MTSMPKFSAFLRGVREKDFEAIRAAAPTTAGNEAIGAEGGFAVPPDAAKAILQTITANSIVGRCKNLPAVGNNAMLPTDESPPWAAAGTYWEAELAQVTQSKPGLAANSFRLNKITALVPVSDETLEDSSLFDQWVRTAIPTRIGAKLTTAIVRGTGVGQPRGILNSTALISVTRAGSVTASAAAAWQRLYGGGRGNAVWLANPDVAIPTTPGLPVLLHGQPVIATEACSAVGAAGDLILADLSQYTLLLKGIRADVSMHVFFDAGASAYRFILRVDGSSNWATAAQPEQGSTTLSPFVTIAA